MYTNEDIIMIGSTSNGMMCSCVSMGNCPTMDNNIDIRIVNTISNCSTGQVYCCSPSSSGNMMDGTCGIRKIPVTPHPQGQASYGAYPWQAALLTMNNAYIGSGVLITPNNVLTVAHKVASYTNGGLKVRLGEWDGQSTNEPYPYQEYLTQNIVMHPNFNSVNLQNDVAVITLSGTVPISSSPNINTACFPSSMPVAGTRCWVSGWGKDAFGMNGQYQSIMKEVDVPIVSQTTCEVSLRQTRLGQYYNLDKYSFLCAGGETGKDACTGDGGSPLVCQSDNGQWQVFGMVAWGIGCATMNVPGIYVNVYNYLTWITQQIVQI
ncbi:inactive CLIP domain-containing serine protease A3 isoform X2 [Nomia melanderi]|uniref:inactive CLIP domain-containing serine protease A3 isoform X2 n=1 Tax=Nomia melanderi TaxID=2448451 RepID=UPI00130463D9|nr:phenoloxidase-activating factor 2 isoform X2 [Nomia melanderi]